MYEEHESGRIDMLDDCGILARLDYHIPDVDVYAPVELDEIWSISTRATREVLSSARVVDILPI